MWVEVAPALIVAAVAVALWEWIASASPVPPGGDESAWLLLANAFLGRATPPGIHLLSYPPVTFPFLGLSVLAAGGPLLGVRLFVGGLLVVLGLATYQAGRALFSTPAVALLAEAGLLFQPDFQQLYYFGGYPNLVGLALLLFSLSFLLRFLRQPRSSWLALFWAFLTAAVLAHALVAALAIALVAVVISVRAYERALPRTFWSSRTAGAGFAVFVAVTLAYYIGSGLTGANPPNYLTTNVLTVPRSQLAFPNLLGPVYLTPVLQSLGSIATLAVVWAIVIGLVAGYFLLGRRRHRDPGVLVLLAWVVVVLGLGLAGWYLGLGADYRRLAYLLYPPLVLGLAFAGDLLLRAWTAAPGSGTADTTPHRRGPFGRGRARPRDVRVALGVAAILLGAAGAVYTVPSAQSLETTFTAVGHDSSFLAALDALDASPTPGSILASTALVDHWPTVLTGRDLYEPRLPTGFTYSPGNLVDFEVAYLALHGRITVTNGQLAATVPGLTAGTFRATPAVGAYVYGVLEPVLTAAPTNLTVELANGSREVAYDPAHPGPLPTVTGPADPATANVSLTYDLPGVRLVENVTALPRTATLRIDLTAVSTGSTPVAGITIGLSSTAAGSAATTASGTGFGWATSTPGGAVTMSGVLGTPGSVAELTSPTTGGAGVNLSTGPVAPSGAPRLALSVVVTAAGTSNTASGVSGFYSTPTVLATWNVAFLLVWNVSADQGPALVSDYETEYGATPYVEDGVWSVLALPPGG